MYITVLIMFWFATWYDLPGRLYRAWSESPPPSFSRVLFPDNSSLWTGSLFEERVRKSWGEGSERVPSLSSQFFHPLPKQRACSQVKILKDQWNTLSPDRCITKCVFRGWLQAICTAPEMIPTPKWYPNLKWSPNSTPKWYRTWNDLQLSSRRPGNDPQLICTEQALFLHVQDTLDSE